MSRFSLNKTNPCINGDLGSNPTSIRNFTRVKKRSSQTTWGYPKRALDGWFHRKSPKSGWQGVALWLRTAPNGRIRTYHWDVPPWVEHGASPRSYVLFHSLTHRITSCWCWTIAKCLMNLSLDSCSMGIYGLYQVVSYSFRQLLSDIPIPTHVFHNDIPIMCPPQL